MVTYTERTRIVGENVDMNKKINFKKKCIEVGSVSICLPIVEIGNNRGKSLAITCGVHGNEATGILLIAELMKRIEKEELNGNIKFILSANPLASLFNCRVSWLDYQDLNRIAPGNPYGTCSERVCRAVLEEVMSQEYFIDLHEWPRTESLIQGIVINDGKDKTSLEMLKVFNPEVKLIIDSSDYANSLYAYAHNKKNKKGFALEIPNSNVITLEHHDRIINSLINVLHYLKILNKPATTYLDKSLTITQTRALISQYNGIFYPLKKIGTRLKANAQIGYVLEYDMKTKHILKNPDENAVIINLAPNTVIKAGDLLCTVAKTKEESN